MTVSQKFIKENNLDVSEEDLGYLVGVFQGDGSFGLNEKYKYPVFTGNFEMLNKIKEITDKFPKKKEYLGIIKFYNKETYVFTAPYSLVGFFKLYGITNKFNKQTVSEEMEKESELFKRGIVKGAFDSDGCLRIYGSQKRIILFQSDQDPEKLKVKKKWLLFIKSILAEKKLDFSLLMRYEKARGYSVKEAYSWNLNANFKSNGNFNKVFSEYFMLHNPDKRSTLLKMVEIERQKNIQRKRNAVKQLKNAQKIIDFLDGVNNE